MQIPFPSDAAPLGTEPAEDCLYMNVWTKPEFKNQPVIVWIHGGGFVNGGGSPSTYSGSAFARDGLVFVSYNYRLGRFGYFAHPALEGSPNFGLQDQYLAVKWIAENVAKFGGDPNNITIMGESAGGMSVNYILREPSLKGLFNRAIIMSGSYLERTSDKDTAAAAEIGKNFASLNNIEGDGPEALAAMRALSADEVAKGVSLMEMFTNPGAYAASYAGGPIHDGITVKDGYSLSDAELNPADIMVGSTLKDIGFMGAASKDELFARFGEDADAARALYDPSGEADLREVIMAVGPDYMMQASVGVQASRYSNMGHLAYTYRFGYVAESMEDRSGAPHASEIPFFFNTEKAKYLDKTTALDSQAADYMHRYVVNFAKTGNPNGEGLPEWKTYAEAASSMMSLNNDAIPQFGEDPFGERLALIRKHMVK
jgi:para-nitrobenzyl esterase